MAKVEVRLPVFEKVEGDEEAGERCACCGDGRPTVMFWFSDEGDEVTEGEPLVEIETGASVLDIPAPASGVLVSVLAPPGGQAEEGQLVGEIESGTANIP